MTNEELIKHLQSLPPKAVVWNYNEGLPTPVSEVEIFTQPMQTTRTDIILS